MDTIDVMKLLRVIQQRENDAWIKVSDGENEDNAYYYNLGVHAALNRLLLSLDSGLFNKES